MVCKNVIATCATLYVSVHDWLLTIWHAIGQISVLMQRSSVWISYMYGCILSMFASYYITTLDIFHAFISGPCASNWTRSLLLY